MPRYFRIPEDCTIKDVDMSGKPLVIVIGWQAYHHAVVWPDDEWGKSSDNYRYQVGLRELFAAAKPGDEVGIDDDVFGVYQPILAKAISRFAQTNPIHMLAYSNRWHFIGPTIDAARKPETDSPIMYGRVSERAKPAAKKRTAARRAIASSHRARRR
jgi:hypothetical protein